jgi:hypothetical protein
MVVAFDPKPPFVFVPRSIYVSPFLLLVLDKSNL